jgi:hypothetical protein
LQSKEYAGLFEQPAICRRVYCSPANHLFVRLLSVVGAPRLMPGTVQVAVTEVLAGACAFIHFRLLTRFLQWIADETLLAIRMQRKTSRSG